MSKKVCIKCGFENEEEYKFCLSCGSSLEAYQSEPAAVGAENEVTADEFFSFAGQSCGELYTKYRKQRFFGSKASFNWPTFLFGILLGMPFIWFIYRKMYKVGLAVLAACAALSVAVTICFMSLCGALVEPIADMMAKYPQEFSIGEEGFGFETAAVQEDDLFDDGFYEEFEAEMQKALRGKEYIIVVLQALNFANLALTITLAIFADRLYFNHLDRKIERYKVEACAGLTNMPLSSRGGVSVGAAIGFSLLFVAVTLIAWLVGIGWLGMHITLALSALM